MTHRATPLDDLPPLEVLDIGTATAPEPASEAPTGSSPWRWTFAAVVVVTAAVAVAWAATRPAPPVATPPEVHTPVSHDAGPPAGIEGFAEMYVATYLTADGQDGATAMARFYAAAPDAGSGGAMRFVTRTATTSIRAAGDGYWVVGVAADVLTNDGVGYLAEPTHQYTVGLVTAGAGFAATGLPTRIASPPPAAIPAVIEGDEVEDSGLRTVVEGFVLAHAAGQGDLATFTSIDADIRSVSPAPYRAITFDTLTVIDIDATTRQAKVTGLGTIDGGTKRPVEYHVTVVTEDGALRIASIAPGPPLATQPSSAPQDSPATPDD